MEKNLRELNTSQGTILKKQIESGHPIDPDELKKLNKYMINPLGEDDVLDKIEDIRLHPSRYVQSFQNLPFR